MDSAPNAFDLAVERDGADWCVVRVVDGRRQVVSRHPSEESATAAARSINDTSRNDVVGERPAERDP